MIIIKFFGTHGMYVELLHSKKTQNNYKNLYLKKLKGGQRERDPSNDFDITDPFGNWVWVMFLKLK